MEILTFLEQHYVALGLLAAYLFQGAVMSLPDPSEKFELYPWVYHTLRVYLNAVPQKYQLTPPSATFPEPPK